MLFAKSKIVSKASTATVSSDHGVWKTQPGRAQQESLVRKVKIAGIADCVRQGSLAACCVPGWLRIYPVRVRPHRTRTSCPLRS